MKKNTPQKSSGIISKQALEQISFKISPAKNPVHSKNPIKKPTDKEPALSDSSLYKILKLFKLQQYARVCLYLFLEQ